MVHAELVDDSLEVEVLFPFAARINLRLWACYPGTLIMLRESLLNHMWLYEYLLGIMLVRLLLTLL